MKLYSQMEIHGIQNTKQYFTYKEPLMVTHGMTIYIPLVTCGL